MKKLFTVTILFLVFFLFSCTPSEKQCSVDSDCAPAGCCHAADAVNEQYAPSCNGVLCTMDCKPETIDCGQGQIKCLQNECTVVLSEE